MKRTAYTKNQQSTTYKILVLLAIVVILNLLSNKLFFRLDFTADKQYTLSQASKDILHSLRETVTVTAYFTEDMPPELSKIRRDFKDLLIEYANASDNNVVYEFVDPATDPLQEQEILQAGIQPAIVSARQKDQIKQQKVYLGALVQMGEASETIPMVQSGAEMEYALSAAIKKLSVVDKPRIGLLQGHGEPPLQAFQQVYAAMSVLNDVETVNLNDSALDLQKYKTIAIVGPKDSIPEEHFRLLDDYLGRGGNLFIACNRVDGDFQTAMGSSVNTGLEHWLAQKGINVENSFIIDASCGSVGVRQQQGSFSFTTRINFPYMPLITTFADHAITRGLEQVVMPFASPVSYSGDTSLQFTPLIMSSPQSGTQSPPIYFDINKQWTENDFPLSRLTVGAILSGKIQGNSEAQMVVLADADFAINGEGQQAQGLQEDNVSLMVNAIDWLSDDTGLIELRTKTISARPLDNVEAGSKALVKWFNFLLPILLIIIYGMLRMQRNKSIRIKRMEEAYV